MTTIELDRQDLAQGMRDATADLREHSLHDVNELAMTARTGIWSMYWDGYYAVLCQAELVAWDLFIATRTTQPTHVRV